jgi:hypothetical protein
LDTVVGLFDHCFSYSGQWSLTKTQGADASKYIDINTVSMLYMYTGGCIYNIIEWYFLL